MTLVPDYLLGENGDPLMLEDGSLWALESDSGVTAVATVTLRQNLSTNAYYWIGDVPVFTATFVDLDGAATDPTIVVFTWRLFDGTETTYTFGDDDEVDTTAWFNRVDRAWIWIEARRPWLAPVSGRAEAGREAWVDDAVAEAERRLDKALGATHQAR